MQLTIVIVLAVTICELLGGRILQVKAQSQLGFVSIDCGGSNANYTDAETTLAWTSDSKGFGLEKVSRVAKVSLPAKYPTWTWLSSMRIFEGTQSKYCYVFNESIVRTNPYLIRASFWTGDSPPFIAANQDQISFKLLLNADEWDNIVINLPQENPLMMEVYVVAVYQSISVCLAGIGGDIAFISSLEIRPIKKSFVSVEEFMQAQQNAAPGAMFLYSRRDSGSTRDVRFPDDIYDRIWSADAGGQVLNSTRYFGSTFPEEPPSAVLQTAAVNNSSLKITFNGFSRSYNFFYVLYFAEVSDDVTEYRKRIFNVYTLAPGVNRTSASIDTFSTGTAEIHSTDLLPVDKGGFLTFDFERASTSSFGPLVNALELLYISHSPMSLGTYESDVVAIEFIKESLQGFDSWRGDPCLPISYEWLTCDDEIPPRIIMLSLQNKNISAEIPPGIGNLKALVELNLQGNNLSGSIPDSIAQLPNLTTLLLQDNNLSGAIPQELLDKGIALRLAGNPILCRDNNPTYCGRQPVNSTTNVDSKKSYIRLVAILVSTCAVVLTLVASIFIFHLRRKGKSDRAVAITHAEVIKYSNLAQHFTSQQIERITNNFKTKLGSGGFGDVFFGTLSTGLNVAVKVSCRRDASQEGVEFLNEVALLSRIHHKNLVEFVGYCIQPRLVLVYEYMAKGSLENYLHGNVNVPLSWRDRLKIVVGAAEGLEYLHKGCKPPVIHRDVKCANILLDEGLEGRLSDFGISRSKLADTHMTVTNVQGTIGYIAPEYAELRITEKIDVFAFGVVLLEVVSGRRPIEGAQHIINWVRPFVNQSTIQKIVDPSIEDDYNMSSMWKVLEVAMACVHTDTERRPDMHEVSLELNSALSFDLQNEMVSLSYDISDLPYDCLNVHTR